jgi:hypothetical protein
MNVRSLLEIDLKKLLSNIEEKFGIKLLRRVIEVYLDAKHDMLFIRFKKTSKTEIGEPLQTKAIVTLFSEEESNEITALEIIGISELLEELS